MWKWIMSHIFGVRYCYCCKKQRFTKDFPYDLCFSCQDNHPELSCWETK